MHEVTPSKPKSGNIQNDDASVDQSIEQHHQREWNLHTYGIIVGCLVVGMTAGGGWVTTLEEGRLKNLDQNQLCIIITSYFWGGIIVKPIQNLFPEVVAVETVFTYCLVAFLGSSLSLCASAFSIQSDNPTLLTTISRFFLGCFHSIFLMSVTSTGSLSFPGGWSFRFSITAILGGLIGLLTLGILYQPVGHRSSLLGLAVVNFIVAMMFIAVQQLLPEHMKSAEVIMRDLSDPIAASYSRKMTGWIGFGNFIATMSLCAISVKIVPFLREVYDMSVFEVSGALSLGFPICCFTSYVLCQVQGIIDGSVEALYPNPNYVIGSCLGGVLYAIPYFYHDSIHSDMRVVKVSILSLSLIAGVTSCTSVLITTWPLLLLTTTRKCASQVFFLSSVSGAAASGVVSSVELFTTLLVVGCSHLVYGVVSVIILRNFFPKEPSYVRICQKHDSDL